MGAENIHSGQDYARLVIDTMTEAELTLPEDERMDDRLLKYLFEEIEAFAPETWYLYLTGKRDTFMFDDKEFKKLFENAGLKYASDILNGLVDKEMVQVGVREDGELVYSMTDKGRDYIEEEDSL